MWFSPTLLSASLIRRLVASAAILANFVGAQMPASAQAPVKIVNHGPDSNRIVIAVVGDGYSKADVQTFKADVDNFVVKGALQHSGYAQQQKAFNVYRVDVASAQSGITTPGDVKNTAFGTRYTGANCYIEESPTTVLLLTRALAAIPRYDYVIVLLNTSEYGGCAVEDKRLYVTRSVGSLVAAHELAHGVAHLYDEYADNIAPYPGDLNDRNCSTILDANTVSWNGLLPAGVQLPSDGTNAAIGMYRGCNRYSSGIYRPTEACFMGDLNHVAFCPVCQELIRHELSKHLVQSAPPQPGLTTGKFVEMLISVSTEGRFQVLDARDRTGQVETAAAQGSEFFVAIQRDGVPVSVAAVPNSTFQRRGYGPPSDSATPHTVIQSDTATVKVMIPGVDLSDINDSRIDLAMYRIEKGANLLLNQSIMPTTLQQLKANSTARMQWIVPETQLKEALATYRKQ